MHDTINPQCCGGIAHRAAQQKPLERIRQVEADRMRLIRIVARYDSVPCEYSVDDIVSEYRRYMKEYTIFTYMNDRISRLQECGRSGTAEHYAAALRSFMAFRNGEDVMIDSIDANMIESYEAWMRMRDLKPFCTAKAKGSVPTRGQCGKLIKCLGVRNV